MIVVDSSALLAIALMEAERDAFTEIIGTNHCLIGAFTALECHMVLRDRSGAEGVEYITTLLTRPHIDLVGFDTELLSVARHAFDRFGKGRHRAGLNFGDCMTYALAKFRGVPLLYKGHDFALTDIRAAVP